MNNKKVFSEKYKKSNNLKNSKKQVFYTIILFILLAIIFGLGIYKFKKYKYHQTNEYKLINHGYIYEDAKNIEEAMNNEEIAYILNIDYYENLSSLIKIKYFKFKNLERYILYSKSTDKSDLNFVVQKVNCNRDRSYYVEPIEADKRKEKSILVNKYYKLSEDYIPDDLVTVSNRYVLTKESLKKEAYEAFIDMYNSAMKDDIKFVITSGYRSYTEQEKLYNDYKKNHGETYADKVVSRPSFSEHQTGLAIDLFMYGTTTKNFDKSKGFFWLQENANKYGYILRFPKEDEDLTGYEYESWHYRYVGKDIAKVIIDEKITFEEYYEYYINK